MKVYDGQGDEIVAYRVRLREALIVGADTVTVTDEIVLCEQVPIAAGSSEEDGR